MPELEWSQPARADLVAIVDYTENSFTVRILRVLHAGQQSPPDQELKA